ncbi:MAG: hypothetical protein AAFY54_01965 [Cyanobacteria bacterium J06648_10]
MPSFPLTAALQKVDEFGTALPYAYRVPFFFASPARILIRVSSVIGEEQDWLRAGSLAQVLAGLPGDPKKSVQRLYLDERFLELDGAGYSYYLEFWPVRWLSDYYLEVWAQLMPGVVLDDTFTIGGEPFTIGGEPFTIGAP